MRHSHEKNSSSTEQSEETPNTNDQDQKKPKVDPTLRKNLDCYTNLLSLI